MTDVKVLVKVQSTETDPSKPSERMFVYKDEGGHIVGYTYYEPSFLSGKAFVVMPDGMGQSFLSTEPFYASTEERLQKYVVDAYADAVEAGYV